MTLPNREAGLERAAAVRDFIQGEVLELADACVVLADAAWPLDDTSIEASARLGGEGIAVVPRSVEAVVLLTQTCDLQRTTSEYYLCQLAPVFGCAAQFARLVLRGRQPSFAALPWLSDAHVADLSLITSVERSLIVGSQSLARPRTPKERLHFAEALSRHFTRAALPDSVCTVLAPFLVRIKNKHDKQSDEGECIRKIATLRIEASPDLDAESPSLRVLIVLEHEDLPSIPEGVELNQERIDALVVRSFGDIASAVLNETDPIHIREAWSALAERWLQDSSDLADSMHDVGHIDVEVLSGDELSFARSRNAPELDLAYLTTRAA
jgi:hypothetical protein